MRLWREMGIELRLTPTWRIPDDWRRKVEAIGCKVVEIKGPDEIESLDMDGETVVSFCNGEFLTHAHRFRAIGCKVIWVGCMCWGFDAEYRHYEQFGSFDAYSFESEYQKGRLIKKLATYGVTDDQTSVIHSPFNYTDFPYGPRPHARESEFYIGRLSRPDTGKFAANLWDVYRRIPYQKIRARIMGWDDNIKAKLGEPPEWTDVMPACAESAQAFISSLHAMVPINGGCEESWSRVGLEAMASGVPIVTQNSWAWREILSHGETGFLCDSDDEIAYNVARLAYDEDLRLQVATRAFQRMRDEIANPEIIANKWRQLIRVAGGLSANHYDAVLA